MSRIIPLELPTPRTDTVFPTLTSGLILAPPSIDSIDWAKAIGGREHNEVLRELLDGRHKNPNVRAQWLSVIRAPTTSHSTVRVILIDALLEIADGVDETGGDALLAAEAGANDPCWEVRLAVADNAWKLGATGDHVLAGLASDEDADVREAARE